MEAPVAASAGLQIVLQVGVAGRQSRDLRRRRGRQRGPAQVGVHDDAGRVDDRREGGREPRREVGRRPPLDLRRRLLAVVDGRRFGAAQVLPHAVGGGP